MRINCVSCGFRIDLDEDYDDYAGQVKCYACGALLEIKLEAGKPKSVKQARPQVHHAGVRGGAPADHEGVSYV